MAVGKKTRDRASSKSRSLGDSLMREWNLDH